MNSHRHNWDRFQRALSTGRLPSTYLFVGPPGVGKRAFAERLAAALLCRQNGGASVEPCEACPDCKQVVAGSHPDYETLSKPVDKNFIPIELLIGDREHRGRQGLCHRLSMKPAQARRKVAIIDDADYLNIEGANSLLKTLEEPSPNSVLILIATSLAKQLPTIRSRCQIVRFPPLTQDEVQQALVNQGSCSDFAEAGALAERSGGSVSRAVALMDESLKELEQVMLPMLARGAFDSVDLAAKVVKHVNASGDDASKRRAALRSVANSVAEFYRREMYSSCGAGDALRSAANVSADNLTTELAAECLQVCLEVEQHLESNANLTTLIECWIDDLGGVAVGRTPFQAPLVF